MITPPIVSRWFPPFVVWAVLGIGLAVTTVLTFAMAREARQRDAARFDRLVHEAKQLLETRVERYELGLADLQDFFITREVVTPAEWAIRLERFYPSVNYPGMIEVGYAHSIRASWRREPPEWIMVREPRRTTPSPSDLPVEQIQWPILFHYAASGWRAVPYGQDLVDLHQPDVVGGPITTAVKLDLPKVSGRRSVKAVDGREVSAFSFYFPVYHANLLAKSGGALSTNRNLVMDARLDHCKGVVFATLDMERLLASVFGSSRAVAFEIYSSKAPRAEEWLNDSTGRMLFGNPDHKPYLNRVDNMQWYGNTWSLYFYTTSAFEATSLQYRPWLAAGIGLPLSLLFAGITWVQVRGRHEAERLAATLRQSEARLQIALREREQISRDLHDGTIQSLYAIGLGLGQLKRTLANAKERNRLDASLQELDHVVAELRSYLVTLDPGVSPAQSASTALSELLARLRQTSGTELRFVSEESAGDGWPPAAVLDLLQAAREGVSNALRHGHATVVKLGLRQQRDGGVSFEIEDNGRGFSPEAPRSKLGHGLVNLARRAEVWNGKLQVDSRPGGPTRVVLSLYPKGANGSARPVDPVDSTTELAMPST